MGARGRRTEGAARSWARSDHARRHRRDAVPTLGDPRVPRPPPTPRLDRKKHRRNPEAAGFGRVGPRNETCGAGPEPTRDAPREPLFPGFTRRRDGTGGEERVSEG